jgi:hypothetical protein
LNIGAGFHRAEADAYAAEGFCSISFRNTASRIDRRRKEVNFFLFTERLSITSKNCVELNSRMLISLEF